MNNDKKSCTHAFSLKKNIYIYIYIYIQRESKPDLEGVIRI